jgi:DNA polymerase III subunit gamma/tau
MSDFIVSARKYRPVNFDTVVGQPAVTRTLKSAIKSGQIAHAYLFCGPRGVGKTTCARILAKTLNCSNLTETTEACNQCESCRSFSDSRSFNIHELDAASNNSVDDIRNLIDKVRILPQMGKYSIYIIDEVHMLSQSAFNAFLKTLEEPPAHAIFILATTEKHKIIPTILSRCQIFDFNRIRVEDIVGYLAGVADQENIRYEEEALNVIAAKADGAMRDALSIFDQVTSFSNKNITYRFVLENLNVLDYEYYFNMTEAFLENSAVKALLLYNEILQRGFDGLNFLGGLSSHFRDLLVCHDENSVRLLEVSDALKSRYKQQAKKCSGEFLFAALEISNQCEITFKSNRNQRLHVELALIRLCNINGEKKNLSHKQNTVPLPDLQKTSGKKNPPENQIIDRETSALHKSGTINDTVPKYNYSGKISIKETLHAAELGIPRIDQSEVNEDHEVEESLIDVKPISEKLLLMCWDSFAAQLRDERPRMAITLKNVRPFIKDNQIISFELSNTDQLEDFNKNIKADLGKFLCRELHRKEIILDASIPDQGSSPQIKLYTNEEKYQYLNQKHPLLAKFKQKLNLELE